MSSVLVTLLSDAEGEAVARVVGDARCVRACFTARELGRVLATQTVRGVVCELRDSTGADVASVFRSQDCRSAMPPILTVMSLTPANAHLILNLIEGGLNVRPILRGYDDLGRIVRQVWERRDSDDAQSAMLRSVAGAIPPSVYDIVVGSIVVGATRCSVNAFATKCRVSTRTLERRIGAGGLLPARRLLGWSLALHAMWRIDMLEWPIKKVATAAGFASSDAFATYFARHTGHTVSAARGCGGFQNLLENLRPIC